MPYKKKHTSLDTYPITKEWEKRVSKKMVNIEDANYILYNNLDIDEMYCNFQSHGNTGKKYNKNK